MALSLAAAQKQMDADQLREAVLEVHGFLLSLKQAAPVDVDDDLLAYLESLPKSKVALNMLLERLQPTRR